MVVGREGKFSKGGQLLEPHVLALDLKYVAVPSPVTVKLAVFVLLPHSDIAMVL